MSALFLTAKRPLPPSCPAATFARAAIERPSRHQAAASELDCADIRRGSSIGFAEIGNDRTAIHAAVAFLQRKHAVFGIDEFGQAEDAVLLALLGRHYDSLSVRRAAVRNHVVIEAVRGQAVFVVD